MKPSSKPLARTPFKAKPKALRTVAPLEAGSPAGKITTYGGSTIKRRTPKKRPGHDKKMLDACRGQRCYLAIPGICCGRIETVVPAHSNEGALGKGMGQKARDEFTVPGCYFCHYAIDQGGMFSYEEKKHFWRSAYREWAPDRENLFGLPYTPYTELPV
jgi:hypothetical protein